MPHIFVDKEAASAAHNAASTIDIENYYSPVINTTTRETLSKYQMLAKKRETPKLFGKELGDLAQLDKKNRN